MLAPRSGETAELIAIAVLVAHYCALCSSRDIYLSFSRTIALLVYHAIYIYPSRALLRSLFITQYISILLAHYCAPCLSHNIYLSFSRTIALFVYRHDTRCHLSDISRVTKQNETCVTISRSLQFYPFSFRSNA